MPLSKYLSAPLRLLKAVASQLRFVVALYFTSRVLASFVFMALEGWDFWDAFWWTGVASLTIGYGDMFPVTMEGRLVADAFQMFWVFFIGPAVIAHLVSFVIRNLNIFTHLEQEWLFTAITRCYELLRYIAQAQLDRSGVTPPFSKDGVIQPLLPQPSDMDDGEEIFDEYDHADAKSV